MLLRYCPEALAWGISDRPLIFSHEETFARMPLRFPSIAIVPFGVDLKDAVEGLAPR